MAENKMHKNTLADIVIKSIRLANSVIDSSYEFPEMDIRANEEIAFRDNVLKYCNACHDNSKKEERAAYTQNILEYAASLQCNEDYGKRLPGLIKAVKRCKNSNRAAILSCYAGLITGFYVPEMGTMGTSLILVSGYGILRSSINSAYDKIWERIHGKPLEKKLIDEYYDYSLQEDIAKETRKVTQKDFNEAMFEHWDDLITALDDVSEQEKKRLLGKKSWE